MEVFARRARTRSCSNRANRDFCCLYSNASLARHRCSTTSVARRDLVRFLPYPVEATVVALIQPRNLPPSCRDSLFDGLSSEYRKEGDTIGGDSSPKPACRDLNGVQANKVKVWSAREIMVVSEGSRRSCGSMLQ